MVEYKAVVIAASRCNQMGAANGLKSGGIQSYEIRNHKLFPWFCNSINLNKP